MRITIELSEEEVRQAIVQKIANEASKYGHPNDVERQVFWSTQEGLVPLDDLKVRIVAKIETK